jgi:hypothetical protein
LEQALLFWLTGLGFACSKFTIKMAILLGLATLYYPFIMIKTLYPHLLFLCLLGLFLPGKSQNTKTGTVPPRSYDIAAFYWPAYHPDKRFREISVFPDGKGEWEAIYKSKPKFAGEQLPKVPLWGYTDESDPAVMEQKIRAATDHGVNTFISTGTGMPASHSLKIASTKVF